MAVSKAVISWRIEWAIVLIGLAIAAALAGTALVGDSLTFDELLHLSAGWDHLKFGDFRLSPQTPPLAQIWGALPLLACDVRWIDSNTSAWHTGDPWIIGREWLYQRNDGERLLAPARAMTVVLLLATCILTWRVARRLFGPAAGLLAFLLAVFDPTMLAHGHLVTTDVAAALCFLLVLWTWARLFERLNWSRWLAALLASAALCLVKFSWPLALLGIAAMIVVAVARRKKTLVGQAIVAEGHPSASSVAGAPRRGGRAVTIVLATVGMAVGVWGLIWTAYGWRYSAFRGADAAIAVFPGFKTEGPPPRTNEEAWKTVLPEGRDGLQSLLVSAVDMSRRRHWLPEAYLYGVAYTAAFRETRPAYLCGAVSERGWLAFFPLAFAIKTPLATVVLLVIGLIALMTRQRRGGPWTHDGTLAVGLAVFGLGYAATAVGMRFDIGHRHLLPIYPIVFIVAGAGADWVLRSADHGLAARLWSSSRPRDSACGARGCTNAPSTEAHAPRIAPWGTALVGAGLMWVIVASLWICPNYISYFNELVGGPARGHLYLVDSSLDWGQDLKRLAAYARRHPDESIKLAYFGSADPAHYGFACTALPSFLPFDPPAKLAPGTCVISATLLHGVYYPLARDEAWDTGPGGRPGVAAEYAQCAEYLRQVASDPRRARPVERAQVAARFEELRPARLVNRLLHRVPDARIGYSLFVYRLGLEDLNELLAP